jgi:hypothetical protein
LNSSPPFNTLAFFNLGFYATTYQLENTLPEPLIGLLEVKIKFVGKTRRQKMDSTVFNTTANIKGARQVMLASPILVQSKKLRFEFGKPTGIVEKENAVLCVIT